MTFNAQSVYVSIFLPNGDFIVDKRVQVDAVCVDCLREIFILF